MRRPSTWAAVARPVIALVVAGFLAALALGLGAVAAEAFPGVPQGAPVGTAEVPDGSVPYGETPVLGLDDYPYREAVCAPTGLTTGRCPGYAWQVDGEPFSPFGFGFRTTTDFVSWRLDQALGGTPAAPAFTWSTLAFPAGDGNAGGWRDGAIASGYRVDSIPERGSVAWWGPGPGTGGGMVAIVTAVHINGTVDVEEYNLAGTGVHGFRSAVRADAYLHIADQPGPVGRPPYFEQPAEPTPPTPPSQGVDAARPDATIAEPA